MWTSWGRWYFHLFRVYSLGFTQHEQVYSLGDEAMLLDLGITVLANDNDGISRNSIYFSDCSNADNVFLYNLMTWKIEKLHKFDCSSVQLSSSRWFLPSNSPRHD
ncbi:putative F-box protein [Raphanus sativus]|nr:putative F-box protein [Raphanus sativus]